MGKINILSKSAAEKIAAGEVVERPANVIKEMVENSVDAGAKSVTVEIRHGGITYIRVTDDGGGILPEDAEKAFMRHATSKIKDENDLEHITTLGFRGEALCSIASVSKTDMLTKLPDMDMGTHITVEGGEITCREEMGCADGTTIVVENLFYNTPARMKFLKKDNAEAAMVTEICQRQALARPDISVRLIRDGREIFFTPGNNSLPDTVRCLWGKDFSSNMGEVKFKSGPIEVFGLAGKNNLSKPTRSMQIFFVNGRNVYNRALSLALADAYKNELMGGRFPVAVINVKINPALCDVNIHPAKSEIKFADDKEIYSAVYWAVKNMLGREAGAREAVASFIRGGESYKLPLEEEKPRQLSVKPGKFKVYNPPPARDGKISAKEDKNDSLHVEINPFLPKKEIERLDEERLNNPEKFGESRFIIKKANLFKSDESEDDEEKDEQKEAEPFASYEKKTFYGESKENARLRKNTANEQNSPGDMPVRIIGQLFSTYIVAEAEKELILIDQHAAHERVRYEKLKNGEMKPSTQLLLEPQKVRLSPEEYAAVTENSGFLWDMGFEMEPMGEGTVLLRSVPSDCFGSDGETLFGELAEILMGGSGGEISDRRDRAMYTIACRSAIKANHELSEGEAELLVKQALSLEGISTCPHGRPISVKITKYQIEKMFKRIV